MATSQILDMTNVKEGSAFNKKRVPEGDYRARISKVEDAPVKGGENKGNPQWLFTITLEDRRATYPYYCQFAENQLWKIRNILVAAGINVPKKRLKLDPEKLVGKMIAVTLEDGEYEGKQQSEIAAIFPVAEMLGEADDDDEAEAEDDEEEEEEPEPAPVRRKRKPAPEPEPEEEEEDEEEEEEPTPPPVKKRRKPVPPPVEDEDEDEDEEEEEEEEAPAPPARKKRKVTAEELEELDIDDL